MRNRQNDNIDDIIYRGARPGEPEAWWIETKARAFGWDAIAHSNWGRVFGKSIDGQGSFPIWRLTERWAERAMARAVRRYYRRQTREAAREERGGVYPVTL